MGALWSTTEGDDEDAGSLLAALFRAIDLRRLSPYHASAALKSGRRENRTAGGRAVGQGLWLPEGARVGESGTGRRAAEWLRFVLHTDDTPSRAALAFAVGVFIAWTPAFGFHTLLALAVAFLFGLNRVAVLAGTFVNNPWTFVPIYTVSAWIGNWITGSEATAPRLEGKTWGHMFDFLAQCRPWIVPLTMGTLVLGSACALLSFPVVLYGIRWYRALRQTG